MKRSVAVIVNPTAARGRAARGWRTLEGRLHSRLGELTVRWTRSAGHATALAAELIEAGHDLIVAVGGDGTLNEVVNGMMGEDDLARPGLRLGFLPIGTGSDFQRTLRLPSNPADAVEVLATGQTRLIDLARIRFTGHDGAVKSCYFVNLVSFGMGGAVAAGAKSFLTVFGGKAAFLGATIQALARYRSRRVELVLDGGKRAFSAEIANVAVGNGRYHGGGMCPCPAAVLDDGVLDVTVIDALSPFQVLRDLRVLYSGDIHRHPKVHALHARRLTARSDDTTLIEVDGESLGRLPLEIELLSRKLPIVVSAACAASGCISAAAP